MSARSTLAVALTIGLGWSTVTLHGATRFTVSGKIQAVTKDSHISLVADKAFYGPPTMPVGVIALWNSAGTFFMCSVPIAIPVTIDGKKAGFRDLKSGEYVVVEYELVSDGVFIVYCAATRVDARSAPARKSNSEKHTSKK